MKTSSIVRLALIIAALIILLSTVVSGQSDIDRDAKFTQENYRLQIKINPAAIFWPRWPSLQGGVEYMLGPKITLNHELGLFYFPRSRNSFFTPANEVAGYKLRNGLRWYLIGHYADRADLYMGLQFQFKQEFENQSSFIERSGGAFQELIDYKTIRNFAAMLIVVGVQGRIGELSRWETDMGLGWRYRWQIFGNLPEDVDPSTIPVSFWDDIAAPLFPMVTLNFRFNFLVPAKEKRRKRSRRR